MTNLHFQAALARIAQRSGLLVLLFSGAAAGCVPANVLDDGPLADRIVNDRWVHPEGLFSFRVTTFGWRPEAVSDLVHGTGGSLNLAKSWREALVLQWGSDAEISDDMILARIRARSPHAQWISECTSEGALDVNGSVSSYRAAWIPKPGANKGVSSAFGFQSLDAFALFVRAERAGIPFLVGVEVEITQGFNDERKGLPFDHVAAFEAEINTHLKQAELAVAGIATEDPALEWFRD